MATVQTYPYQLVEFTTGDVDVVPSTWISFDSTTSQCVTSFMPPPYDLKTSEELHSLIKDCAEPPNIWPTYPVKLKGQAKSYVDALDRLETLKTKQYAYSSNSDMGPEETAKAIQQSYRCRKQKIDKAVTKALLKVPDIIEESPSSGSDISSVVSPTPSTSDESCGDAPEKTKIKLGRQSQQKMERSNPNHDSSLALPRSIEVDARISRIPRHNKQLQIIPTPSPISESDEDAHKKSKKHSKKQHQEEKSDHNHNSSLVSLQSIKVTPRTSKINTQCHKKQLQGSQHEQSVHKNRSTAPNITPENLRFSSRNEYLQTSEKEFAKKGLAELSAKNHSKLGKSKTPNYSFSPNSNSQRLERVVTEVSTRLSSTSNQKISHKPQKTVGERQSSKENLILAKVVGLCEDVKELSKEMRSLRTIIETANMGNNDVHFLEQDDLTIPLRNMVDFKDFDEKLGDKENPAFRNKIVHSLRFHIDRDGILSKSIRSMLKHYITREVALSFTAMKKTPGKEVFKETNFCAVMIGVINGQNLKNGKSPITQIVFYQQLGHVISNAKDWDGHRQSRKKHANPIPEVNDDPMQN